MTQAPSPATCGYTLLQYLSSTHDLLKGSLYLNNAHLSVSPTYLPIALTVMYRRTAITTWTIGLFLHI